MTLMINLSDHDYEEYEDEEDVGSEEGYPMFDDSDEESQWSSIVANRTRIESDLLHGAVAPALVIQQQQQQEPKTAPSVLASFITNNGYIDHSLIAECAVRELHTLALDNGGLLWTPIDGNTDILDEQLYQQTFPRPEPPTTTTTWTHASRASAVVRMDHIKLAKILANCDKWTELFPSIVSKVIFLRVLFQRSSFNNPDGSLDLIYTELQATTPRFYARIFAFLRTCKQIDQSTWVVADVSIDGSRKVGYPCGCLIQGLGDGLSRVTWVEHLEFEETYLDYKLFTDLTNRGFAYGAERWTACLEQSCERIFYQNKTDVLLPLFLGQDGPFEFEKKLVMKLSQRMVRTFCLNIGPTETMRYLPGPRNLKVYTTVRQSPYHDDPKEMVVISATTFGLPHPPESVFQILADEHTCHEWDPSRSIAQFKKPTCYRTGADSRNRICVFKTLSWISDEVVLQEASVNRSGSLLVWSLLKSEGFERVRTGKDPSSRPALIELAGLAISANSQRKSTSFITKIGGGSIVTLGVQQEACDIKGLEPKTVELVQEYIKMAVKRIEAVLKKKTGPSSEGTNKGKGIFSM